MSARQPYYEIVQRDDGWLARLRGGNGHKVFTSELYTRKRAAERAVEIGSGSAILDVSDEDGERFIVQTTPTRWSLLTVLEVRYIDERTATS